MFDYEETGPCETAYAVSSMEDDPGRSAADVSAAARLLGAEGRSEQVRGARLAALQTALVKASAEEGLPQELVFHHGTEAGVRR
ncbi:hypothetical protein GCM10010377_52050 [Streptomyces viridiviolaceus]|uniref:Uncharacterized protein n=1 Tax=Streptomyces viridiviolaceus TaxID=68282 RepID=A0ABW2E5P1_9ACTN|nr:hypothetical protein [Streptomyces viridiviolaceus]GHB54537.1 hypothetical protein GCM10010377_52050 [Streptomyces viridiviolaceus]